MLVNNINSGESGSAADQPAARDRPRVWPVFVAVVLAVVAAIGWQAVIALVLVAPHIAPGMNPAQLQTRIMEELATPTMLILIASGGQVAFGLGALVAARLSPEPVRERLGLLPVQGPRNIYPLAMFGSLVPLAIGLGLAEALALVLPPDPSVAMVYEKMTLAISVPFVLFIALAPGICEELMFRGYVQRRLQQRWSPAWAIGITSVIFALCHVSPHTIVAVLPIGLWWSVVAWRCRSIYPGILCHAFVNGSVNAWRVVVKFAEVPETFQYVFLAASLLIGVVCFVLLLCSFASDKPNSAQSDNDDEF